MARNNIFVNIIPATSIHDKTSTTGHAYKTVSLEVDGTVSASGTLTIAVNSAQVYNGRVAGCKNVMLGEPTKVIKCRVCNTNGVYYDTEYTAQELADLVKAYRASDAAVAAAKAAAKRTADAQ